VPSFESNLDQQRRVELLRRALTQLPAAKRTLLELFYINDHSIPQIAALQDRSVSAVKMELARSRRSLSRIIHSMLNQRNPWNSRL
jgi:DNA-directed RNA polymerase specialized sigma24 family protein